MNQVILQLCLPFLLVAIGLFVLAGFIWLFFNHGIDKIRHPEEWKDQGSSGERIIYRTLVDQIHVPENQIHVPENQILRNVYVPTADGKTSVMTKRGARILEGYKGNEWMNKLGVIDAGGNVDLEILREAALERIPDEGIKIDVPLIGKMTFYRQDVETLYQFIV